MENSAPKESDRRSSAEPGPRVILIATVVAFGGAIAVYGLKPWGPWVGIALMTAWVIVLSAASTAQDRRDRAAGLVPEQPKPRRISILEMILRSLVFGGAVCCFAYAYWLERNGASRDQIQSVQNGAMILTFLGYLASLAVQMIFSWLARRQTTSAASQA